MSSRSAIDVMKVIAESNRTILKNEYKGNKYLLIKSKEFVHFSKN